MKTYYYIETTTIKGKPPFINDIIQRWVADRILHFNEFMYIVSENDNEIVVEENPGDYLFCRKYYKNKDFAKKILEEIIKNEDEAKLLKYKTNTEYFLEIEGFQKRK